MKKLFSFLLATLLSFTALADVEDNGARIQLDHVNTGHVQLPQRSGGRRYEHSLDTSAANAANLVSNTKENSSC